MKIDVYASGSKGNCYRISDGKTDLLLECGISAREILKAIDFGVSLIEGCLVSHEHGDHSKGVKDMLRIGFDVYTSQGTLDALNVSGHHCHPVQAGRSFRIGTFDIYPFDTEHDAAEPLGFVITSTDTRERLLFFTDTYYVKYVFRNVNYIMGECNYSERTLRPDLERSRMDRLFESHMSLEHLIELLGHYDMTQVKQIYLLHLSDDNSDEELFKREVQRATGVEVYVC